MKLEFLDSFEKYSNIKLHENPSSGSRVDPYGRTHRRAEANSHFSQICNPPGKREFFKLNLNEASLVVTLI